MSSGGGGSAGPPILEQAKDQAQEALHTAKQRGGELVDQTRQQLQSQLNSQKDTAAQSIGTVAQAIRQTGDQLRSQEQAAVAEYAGRLADVVEDVSGYLRERSIEDMAGDVESFARRNPAVFLGAAFGLGFLAARFLKSSSSQGGYASGSARQWRGSTPEWDRGEATQTAAGSVWDGEERPDSPRGLPLDTAMRGTRAALPSDTDDDTADTYETTGATQ